MGRRRMLGSGQSSPIIPTPELGVCTVYPIAIPVTSGLLHYSSAFNWCDHHADYTTNDGLALSNNIVFGSNQGLVGPRMRAFNNLSNRRIRYNDLGSGNVGWHTDGFGGSVRFVEFDASYIASTTVQTVVVLAKAPASITASNATLGFHDGTFGAASRLRISTSGSLDYLDNALRASSITPALGAWGVFSVRFNSNVVVGYDLTYQQVKATAAATPGGAFTIFSPRGQFNIAWIGAAGHGGREIAIYDRPLSDSEMDTMVNYMRNKWNL